MDNNIERAITELKEKVERYFAGKVKRGPKPRWPRRLKEQAVELLLRGVSRDELATSTGTKPSNITRWYRDYKRSEQMRKCGLEEGQFNLAELADNENDQDSRFTEVKVVTSPAERERSLTSKQTIKHKTIKEALSRPGLSVITGLKYEEVSKLLQEGLI